MGDAQGLTTRFMAQTEPKTRRNHEIYVGFS